MGVLSSIGYMLGTIWRADKGCVVFSFYKQCSEELFNAFFVVYFTKTLYGYVQQGAQFSSVVRLAAIFCSIQICIHVASALHAYYIRLKTPEVYRRMFSEVMDKAQKLELRRYEEPDFYNKFARALDECLTKAMDGLYSFTLACGEGIGVIVSIVIVSTIDPLLVAFLLPPVLASFWLGARRNKLQFALGNEETPYRRTMDYAKRVFYEKKYAGELRLYGIRDLLFLKHRASYMERYRITVRYNRKLFAYMLCQQLVMFCLMSASISLYVAYVLKIRGAASVGAYTAILMTSGFITWKAGDAVQKSIEAGKHCIFMNNLRDFLECEEEQSPVDDAPREIGPGKAPVPSGEKLGDIVFDRVRFAYQGAASPVIDELSLSIRRGEKIALVGENGAGKTTLVKLLMGLYPLSSGTISVNGRDIREYESESYRARFGAVFQDLQVFSLPLGENVLLRSPETEQDRELAARSLELAQFGDTLARLPLGIDTPVTKEFDERGFVCSGGQAQKIAIARVFAKSPDIVILDEPSSALDPIAEFYMYENMMKASEGRTVFFISHRLSSARLADRVFYLESGRVAEFGTHDELIARNGRYASMFALQAASYREESYETIEGNALYGK
jgi:ABC-type bacteriocin/lantibiotic exporters, contain an N-terminal double-glycine peptidase domain